MGTWVPESRCARQIREKDRRSSRAGPRGKFARRTKGQTGRPGTRGRPGRRVESWVPGHLGANSKGKPTSNSKGQIRRGLKSNSRGRLRRRLRGEGRRNLQTNSRGKFAKKAWGTYRRIPRANLGSEFGGKPTSETKGQAQKQDSGERNRAPEKYIRVASCRATLERLESKSKMQANWLIQRVVSGNLTADRKDRFGRQF